MFEEIPEYQELELKMRCKCECGKRSQNNFLQTLFFAQQQFGKPIDVHSGARCAKHNAATPGADPNSAALYGEHADLGYQTTGELFLLISALIKVGFERFRLYPHHLHIDKHPSFPVPSFAWANYPPPK